MNQRGLANERHRTLRRRSGEFTTTVVGSRPTDDCPQPRGELTPSVANRVTPFYEVFWR
jgi:hypothetical protein